ncbi:hypothetical protein H6P81_012444 [Aristolochia fimbriata]|uniref:TF-B3 domain-containing protein n=1 Tax=Aristolochia fimbriata TaxID=158543 RepID=A0AAV7ED45_ARIFI|nr:hypothetical protein H6P81_012444 [Aristolochia fimbriata]
MEKVPKEKGGKAQACHVCMHRCSVLHGKRTSHSAPRSFFKIMAPRTLEGPMCLPPLFASHTGNLIDQEKYLEDISGRRWPVKLCTVKGSLAFKCGWRDFVLDHSLEYGDLLLFRYIDSHFLVEIFGTSACEKLNFLEAETGSCQKGKQTSNRENVEQLHPNSNLASSGISKENGENRHKRQRVLVSDTRESLPKKSDAQEGIGGTVHQSSRRNLKSSITKNRGSVKWNTPDRTISSVQVPPTHKNSGHANARKVVSSTIHQVPMMKPRKKSNTLTSEKLPRKEYICKGNVTILDSDSEDMEKEPASIGTSSKHDNGSKGSDEPEGPLGVSGGHSPDEERDVREKNTTMCQSERMSYDLDEPHGAHGEDSSHCIQNQNSSMPFCKSPKLDIGLNSSVAKRKAPTHISTGKAFHDQNAKFQGTVNLCHTVVVEGDSDGNTVNRGSMLVKNSGLSRSKLRKTHDVSETPSKVLSLDMINEEDVGKNRVFSSKILSVFATEEEGNSQDLIRSLRVAENSLDCKRDVERTYDAVLRKGRTFDVREKFSDNKVLASLIKVPKNKGFSAEDSNASLKVNDPHCHMSHKDTVALKGDEGIGNINAVMSNMEDMTGVPKSVKIASNPEGSLGGVLLESLGDIGNMHLAQQQIDPHCLGNRGASTPRVGTERSAYGDSKTWKTPDRLSFENSKESVQVTGSEKSPETSMLEPKCAQVPLNSESSMVGAKLRVDTTNAEAVHLAQRHAGEYPPANDNNSKSRTGIRPTAYRSINACKAPEVPSSGIDVSMNAAASRSVSFLETKKGMCQTKKVKREPNSVELDFSFEYGSSKPFMKLQAKSVEIVSDEHIGKHTSGAGNEHNSVPEESKHCQRGASTVRFKCLVSVQNLSLLDLPSEFPLSLPKRGNRLEKSVIVLSDSNMNQWPILYCETRNAQKSFCSGWKCFAAANGIREGDVCLLEVTDELPEGFHVRLSKQQDTQKVK